jgi:hypothetical protein
LEIGFIDHLHDITTNNFNTIANFHILQFTTVHAKSFQSASVSGFPATDHSNGYSSTAPSLLFTDSLRTNSGLLYDVLFTAYQFVLATSPLILTTSTLIYQLNTCGYSPYATFSLTRGWVCRLQLLLALASAVIIGPESCGTHDHILLSQMRLPQPGGPGPRIYIPQEQGAPVIAPGTGFTFRRFLRLSELRRRYSNPLPYGG